MYIKLLDRIYIYIISINKMMLIKKTEKKINLFSFKFGMDDLNLNFV